MNRQKILIFSIVGLLLVGVVWMFIDAASSETVQPDGEVSLSAEIPKEFTYKDMMAANAQNKNSYLHREEPKVSGSGITENGEEQDFYSQQNLEDIQRIQQQIIENNNERPVYSQSRHVEQNLPKDAREIVTDVHTKPEIHTEITSEGYEKKETEEVSAPKKNSRFFSVDMNNKSVANSIKAMVYGDQEVTDGATLKMRLNEDCITDDGLKITKNTSIWGIVSLQGERVLVNIQSIKIGNNMYPFKKKVFGSDAIEGIYIPGNFKAETRQEVIGEGISNLDVPIRSTGVIGDVVGSVLQVGKNATSRNVRKTKVLIKTNYEIYLR